MKDLTRRFVVSAISIAIVVLLLLFAFHPWFQYAIALVIALLTCVAIWEYEQFAKAKGGRMILPVLLICTLLQVLSFYGLRGFPIC